ncbi:microfibrillar-associated protein 2 [Carcharodon carcharias]|uniref:microfibrillar-associated protein 2 n=1 Tax=Carcharodon carcharias TaxID=13397 RepID=UPI001B7DF720|nr:microfibrillar-associated protein 2 [Carcharodon carcharias]
MAARAACLVLLCLPAMLQGQYEELPDTHLYPLQPQYAQYDTQLSANDYNPEFDYTGTNFETEPTEPGPLDCREEQYPCTRLYSVHRPCKQCLKSLCFYSLRRVYVVNKEVCVRTVCAHEELLRADLCRDKYSKCGVMASSGLCGQMASSCDKSCGSC